MSVCRYRLPLLMLLVCSVKSACAQFTAPEPIDYAVYRSPSGAYALTVDPVDRLGTVADYVMRRNGQVVWSGRRPFTLRELMVTDVGTAIGYSLVGMPVGDRTDVRGFVDVCGFDRLGKLRRLDHLPRTMPRVFDSPPYPLVDGALTDPDGNRYTVRLTRWRQPSQQEEWREYAASGEKGVSVWNTDAFLRFAGEYRSIVAAVFLPHRPLMLVQIDTPDGFVLMLLNRHHKAVWKWGIDDDFDGSDGDSARWKSSIVSLSESEFTVKSASRMQTITFAPRKVAGRWTTGQTRVSKAVAVAVDMSPGKRVPLVRLSPVKLTPPKYAVEPAVRHIGPFTCAGLDRLAFVRDGYKRKASLVVVDLSGQVKAQVDLPSLSKQWARWSSTAWLGGSRFAVGSRNSEKSVSVVIVDVEKHSVAPVPGMDIGSVESIGAFPDGRYVILGEVQQQYSSYFVLACFSSEGKRLWRWVGNGGSPPARAGSPEFPNDVAIVDGNVWIIEAVGHMLRMYDGKTGGHLRSIDLAKVWKGRDPEYVSQIWPDMNGAIVRDSSSTNPYVRINSDGAIRSAFTPTNRDGKAIGTMHNAMEAGPGGTLWTTDGDMIYKLDQGGKVVGELGERPVTTVPRDIVALTIGNSGHVYATDKRTGALHVFDSHGVWLRRYLFPARTVQDSKLLTDALSTDQLRDELNIVTSSEVVGRVDHGAFSSYDARDTATNWIPLHTWRRNESHNHGAGRFWTFAYGGNVQEVFPDGQVRTIDRRPDRTWLRTGYPIAVSPEGRAAVVDSRQGPLGQPSPLENDLVCLYNADGSPDRVLTTPRGFTGAAIAYDGHRIVLVKGAHAVCLDMRGHVVWSSTIGAAGGEPTLIDNGRILCIWPGGDTIERYRMP